MHQVLLCNESEFFRGCLQTQFSEASTAVIPLPKDETDVVERFLQWLYSGRCGSIARHTDRRIDYAFGDKYLSDTYCNAIIDETRAFFKAGDLHFSLQGVRLVYDAGLRTKPFGEYALKTWVYRLQTANAPGAFEGLIKAIKETKITQNLSTDMLVQIVEFRKAPWGNPDHWEGCYFHVGEHCCSAKAEK